MTIPNIFHFIWLGSSFPEEISIDSFKAWYPTYQKIFWDDSKCSDILSKSSLEIQRVYHGFNHPVMKADFMRYLILREHGGVYSDLDVTMLSPHLHEVLMSEQAVFFTESVMDEQEAAETSSYRIRKGIPEDCRRIANYFIASTAFHAIWDEVIAELLHRAQNDALEVYDVFYITGPDLLSTVVNRRKIRDHLVLSQQETDKYLRHGETGTGGWKTKFPK